MRMERERRTTFIVQERLNKMRERKRERERERGKERGSRNID
jgi:hypothetical protein